MVIKEKPSKAKKAAAATVKKVKTKTIMNDDGDFIEVVDSDGINTNKKNVS